LKVWGFELPSSIAMKSNFGRFTRNDGDMMGIQYGTSDFFEMEDLYDQELLKNRAVPGTPSYVWPVYDAQKNIVKPGESDRMKELVEKEHFNSLDIPFFFKDNPNRSKSYLASTARWLDSLGYLKMSYVDLGIEPHNAADYKNIRSLASVVKSANPGILRFCTVETTPQDKSWGNLYGDVDIWAPLWGMWDEKTAAERLEKGEELWSYTALCQGPAGTPWWQIDMDPLNFRSPLWISWHYNITGFHYWSSAYWDDYGSLQGVWESPHYQGQFWGEGLLLYPGNVAGTDHFVPSIRLKLYREAEEDYEYMTMASKMGMKEEVDKIVAGIATSFQDWSHDNSAYEEAREKLADLILSKK
ncbi:MAG TPA: hypothetical protein VJ963_08455, partial [Bacteroidales bacterium]|nr:hypothetical protein [Bacteroidales bacterium]